MTTLTQATVRWMNEALNRADKSNDVKTKADADGKYIRTPWELCEEIVGQIAALSPLQGKKILVVDTVEFIPVLLAFGAEKCNITYVAPYAYKGASIAGVIGVRVVQQSLLEWKPDMKFDVIVGNPPYQDGKDKTLYQKFVLKAFSTSDIVAMITPSGWVSFSGKCKSFFDAVISKKITHYKFMGTEAFPGAQIMTVWFICNSNKKDNLITINGVRQELKEIKFLPAGSTTIASIIEKVKEKGDLRPLVAKIGSLYRKDTVLDPAGVKCIASAGRKDSDFDWNYVSAEHKKNGSVVGFGIHKVVFSGFTSVGKLGPAKYADPTFGCGAQCLYVEVDDKQQAERLINFFESSIFKVCLAEMKSSVCSTSRRMLKTFPLIDLSRTWTDAELYAHFGLTQEEIDYIEAIVK